MIDELKKLPPLSPNLSPVRKVKMKPQAKPRTERKKRSIKDRPNDDNETLNPVSQLVEITQSHKEKEPAYVIISKSGDFKRREIVIEVTARGMKARGIGANKKIATRSAAQSNSKELFQAKIGSFSVFFSDLLIALSEKEKSLGSLNQENNSTLANQNVTVEELTKVNQINENNSETVSSTSTTNPKTVPVTKVSPGKVPGLLILRQPKRGKWN